MISTKKLIQMARKWQRVVAVKRKRISFPRSNPPAAEKGHFVVYTTDKRRFSFPITYLTNPIFQELMKMSEEEFGLPSDGPVNLPCDSNIIKYLVSMMQRHIDLDLEKAILMSISSDRCSLLSNSVQQEHSSQQLLVF